MKYIKLYESAGSAINVEVETPFIGMSKEKSLVKYASVAEFGEKVKLVSDDILTYFKPEKASVSSNNKIYYTSTDSNIVTPYAANVFGVDIVSNTYENGQGCITFDGDVTSIGGSAFWSCTGLTSITIPDSVTSIGVDAFYNCTGLTSITIPDSVTSIGNSAFYCCTGLTGTLTIPDSVTTINNMAFYWCTGLTGLTIGNSVTSIGKSAFTNCSGLTGTLTIPNSVISIGGSTFYGCSGLTSVTIPNSVTSIGKYAFYNVAKVIYSGTATGSPWGAKSVVTSE